MKRILAALMCIILLISALPALAVQEWEYKEKEEGIVLTRYIGEDTDVSIPKDMAGRKVYRIAKNVFEGIESITTITFLRKNVEIADGALERFENLLVLCKEGGSVAEYCAAKGIEYAYLSDDTGNTPAPSASTSPAPTAEVTPTPTVEATPESTYEGTPEPTAEASQEPTAEITQAPTPEVSPESTIEITFEPTAETTPESTQETTPAPTAEVSPEPSIAPEPTEIILDVKKATLGIGQKWQITVRTNPESELTYKSRNKKIAKVSKSGLVTALKNGSTRIDITTANGLTASVKINVVAAPSKLAAAPGLKILGVGESTSVTYAIPTGSATEITYASKKPGVAEISADGIITAIAPGKTKITASTHNGKKSSFTIEVKDAPSNISCDCPSIMGIKQKFTLKPVLDEGSSSKITYTSSNPDCVKVSSKGIVTAKSTGNAVIRISTYLEGIYHEIPVTVTEAPLYVSFGMEKLTLGVGDKYTIEPETGGMGASFSYKTSAKAVATVNAKGVITARRKGTAYITVTTHNGRSAKLKVKVKNAPTEIQFQAEEVKLFYKETFQLSWSMPTGTHTELTFTSSDETIATVDENGLVTGVAPGSCNITVTTNNGMSDTCRVITYDESYPVTITLDSARYYMEEGKTFTPPLVVQPESADASMEWKSSRKAVATVAKDGTVNGESHGNAIITGKCIKNPDIIISYEIVVLSNDRCLVVPEQRTTLDGISANIKKINNVYKSALNQVEILLANKKISKAEYERRQTVLRQAFEMLVFPFIVENEQPYWKKANSEGGKKNFIPGVVYFGLPYISGSGANRQYNVTKAVGQKYYVKDGDHYVMNQKKLLNNKYVGNDCSSFVGMATWGINSPYSYLRTSDIATSPAYVTINDSEALRPGDIINRPNSHAIMFLYYADKAKKQMVIMEQGGRGEFTNTVWCSIVNVNTYLGAGYKIRRLRVW